MRENPTDPHPDSDNGVGGAVRQTFLVTVAEETRSQPRLANSDEKPDGGERKSRARKEGEPDSRTWGYQPPRLS